MLTKLLMRVVVVTVNCRLFESAIHALHLTVRPGMIGLSQAMLDTLFGTDAIKQQRESVTVCWAIGELNAVVGQKGMDFVGHSSDQVTQELGSDRTGHAFVQFSEGKLGCAVNRYKQ